VLAFELPDSEYSGFTKIRSAPKYTDAKDFPITVSQQFGVISHLSFAHPQEIHMPQPSAVTVQSFRLSGYGGAGSGMVLKVVGQDRKTERMIVAMESLTHLQVLLNDFLKVNTELQDLKLDPEVFLTDFNNMKPLLDERDLGNFRRSEVKNKFDIKEFDGKVALATGSLDDDIQVFLMSWETATYLAGQAAELIRRLRS
jgi:hypothetical protein